MNNIKVGDLVMVAYSCCNDGLGRVGTVRGFSKRPTYGVMRCNRCGNAFPKITKAADIGDGEEWPLSWLKRIPPLSELEKNKEELHA